MLDRGIAGSEHDCDVDEGTSCKFQNEDLGCCRAGVWLQRTRGVLPRSKVHVTRFLSRQVPRTGHAGVRRVDGQPPVAPWSSRPAVPYLM